jgi:hypothetical protein
MTRTVGATQRLRLQVERIDEYMATQRQQEFALSSPGQGPSALNNVEPSLHGWLPPRTTAFAMAGSIHGGLWVCSYCNTNNMSGMPGGEDQFQFQLPPELLEDWPWPFDMTQGFGAF